MIDNFSEVDLGRHISCEVCDNTVTGGYDPDTNQVNVIKNLCMYQYVSNIKYFIFFRL